MNCKWLSSTVRCTTFNIEDYVVEPEAEPWATYSGALRDTRATLITSEAYFVFTSDSDQTFDDEGFSIYYEFTDVPPG